MSVPPKLIVVDGPRGIGKSTLIANLQRLLTAKGLNVVYLPERLDMWTNWCGENELKRTIEKGDNRFFFQSLVLHSYKVSLQSAFKTKPNAIILERWPGSAVHVFSEMALRDKKMSVGEVQLIKELSKDFPKPTMIIGLWCSNYCTVRDRVNARTVENTSEEWTEQIYKMYGEYFTTLSGDSNYNFVSLDTGCSPETVARKAVANVESLFSN